MLLVCIILRKSLASFKAAVREQRHISTKSVF